MHACVYIVQNILHTACFFFLLPSNRFYCILLLSALTLLLPSDGWEYSYNIFLIIPPLTHSPFHKFTHSSLIRSPTHLFTNSPSHLSTYPLTQPIHPTHQQKCIENCLLLRAERSLELRTPSSTLRPPSPTLRRTGGNGARSLSLASNGALSVSAAALWSS